MAGGSLITRLYDFLDGQTIHEFHLDNEFNRVHEWLNGKLGDANIAADADIAGSKLADKSTSEEKLITGAGILSALRSDGISYLTDFQDTRDIQKIGAGTYWSDTVNAVAGAMQLSVGPAVFSSYIMRRIVQGGSWNKNRTIKFRVGFSGNTDNVQIFLGSGSDSVVGSLGDPRIGFLIDSSNLYAEVGNGVTYTRTLIGPAAALMFGTFRIELTAGVKAVFYIDGVVKATITTNIPSGVSYAHQLLGVIIKNTTAAQKYLDLYQMGAYQHP